MKKSKNGIGLFTLIIFAVLIIIIIIVVLRLISSAVGNDTKVLDSLIGQIYENETATEFDIEVGEAILKFEEGDFFAVNTNNRYVDSKIENNVLKVTERDHSSVVLEKETSTVVITIPRNFNLNTIKMKIGAGDTTINNINVSKSADIEAGAGKITILSGTINNLNLTLGVGNAEITSKLTGISEIEAGVGNLKLTLLGDKEAYSINAEKGLGTVNIYGTKAIESYWFGDGESIVNISGGIGNVEVDFKE
ncbi:MAG: DUF4097 family beta strand repeat protein [Clostridia bacterium]|nr:DUF4097 family beta strand repeat protein [Clostridia bacterium]